RWFVRSSIRKTSMRELSCTFRWTVWTSEIAGGATGLQAWSAVGRRDCIACHALAIHGSGCGRRVSVLESWTSVSMRRLHNKSLQLSPKILSGTVDAVRRFHEVLG